jgi:hypothetical protein
VIWVVLNEMKNLSRSSFNDRDFSRKNGEISLNGSLENEKEGNCGCDVMLCKEVPTHLQHLSCMCSHLKHIHPKLFIINHAVVILEMLRCFKLSSKKGLTTLHLIRVVVIWQHWPKKHLNLLLIRINELVTEINFHQMPGYYGDKCVQRINANR